MGLPLFFTRHDAASEHTMKQEAVRLKDYPASLCEDHNVTFTDVPVIVLSVFSDLRYLIFITKYELASVSFHLQKKKTTHTYAFS